MAEKRQHGGRHGPHEDLLTDDRLMLKSGPQKGSVSRVLDVSPFGMGIVIDIALQIGSRVMLRYQVENRPLELFATVVWAELDESRGETQRLYGLCFQEDQIEVNTIFFYDALISS